MRLSVSHVSQIADFVERPNFILGETDMKSIIKSALIGALLMAGSSVAYAACDIDKGSVRIIGNEFKAIQILGNRAKECAKDGVTVEANLTAMQNETSSCSHSVCR